MNLLWLAPAAVALLGTMVLAVLAGRLGEAADQLGVELHRMGEVRRALAAARGDADALGASMDHLHRR